MKNTFFKRIFKLVIAFFITAGTLNTVSADTKPVPSKDICRIAPTGGNTTTHQIRLFWGTVVITWN